MNRRKTIVDNIIFDSKLESDIYILFKEAKLNFKLQPEFELFSSFQYRDIDNKLHKYRNIVYTPDFLIDNKYAIEVKGFATGEYMLRKKLFIMLYNKEYIHVQINNIKEAKELIEKLKCKEIQ